VKWSKKLRVRIGFAKNSYQQEVMEVVWQKVN
jgi:hypothetical protein